MEVGESFLPVHIGGRNMKIKGAQDARIGRMTVNNPELERLAKKLKPAIIASKGLIISEDLSWKKDLIEGRTQVK